MNTLDLYKAALQTKTAITPHAPYLFALSCHCRTVAELGVRSGVSTFALLAGSRGGMTRMYSYDHFYRQEVVDRCMLAAPDVFVFVRRDTSLHAIDAQVDLLLIDTKHTFEQLSAELALNVRLVNRWIVLHDTELFGRKGEGKGFVRGLVPAVNLFLASNPEWFISRHVKNSCGLTTLSRNAVDRPKTEIRL